MNSKSNGKYSVHVLLSCPELGHRWFVDDNDRVKILYYLSKAKNSKLSEKIRTYDELYKGFWVILDKLKLHVLGSNIVIFSDGIISIKYDKSRRLEKFLFRSISDCKLPDYVRMKIEYTMDNTYVSIPYNKKYEI